MELNKAKEMTGELMVKYGLFQNGWVFKIDRAIRRLGCCIEGRKEIHLSQHFIELNDDAEIKDTILHEIAHALVGGINHHNHVWQTMAINLGCRPNRCNNDAQIPKGKWSAQCSGCQKILHRYRFSAGMKRQSLICACRTGDTLVWKVNE